MRRALFFLAVAAFAQPQTPLPAVNEAALATKLLEMAKPSTGERAIILFDPAYYPGITERLRDGLHQRGVDVYLIVEDSVAMIESYRGRNERHDRRADEVVATLLPLFRKADIFYWMPARGYVSDLRWERLVDQSNVRSIHFHWMLPFPGNRDAATIESETKRIERACLETDEQDHDRKQARVAAFLKGKELRVTNESGTDLRIPIPLDQWFHLGNSDASKENAARARSIRDRQKELPIGMFMFVPVQESFRGTIANPQIYGSPSVKEARLHFERGRVAQYSAVAGADELTSDFEDIGPDGKLISAVFLPTLNPSRPNDGIGFDIGSNWEHGGKNRAVGMRRIVARVANPTLTADGRVFYRDGKYLWDAIP